MIETPGATFRKSGEHVTRTIAGETLVVPIRAAAADLDSIYVFNDTGAAIWTLLDTPRGLEDIARAVADEFEVTSEAARGDVVRFLQMLHEAGLVETQPIP
jgi:hypothetical protein